MHTKKTITLVGAGRSAQALAAKLVKGNNRLLVFSHLYNEAELITAAIKNKNASADIEAVRCSYAASWEADIIITTISYSELKELVSLIKDVSVQKILVIGEIADDPDQALLNGVDEIKKALPYTNIIKIVFNIHGNYSIDHSIKGSNKESIEILKYLFEEAGMLELWVLTQAFTASG